jgi:hypothetical protein
MIDMARGIVWQHGQTGNPGRDGDQLDDPNSAELLKIGHTVMPTRATTA